MVAKPADQPYHEDKRAMRKVKHERTADCVVAGFRWHKDGEGVGSLLLGMYDDEGSLHHVGVSSSVTPRRRELVEELAELRNGPSRTTRGPTGRPWRPTPRRPGRMPGGVSRLERGQQGSAAGGLSGPSSWRRSGTNTFLGGRFRHGGRLVRFRPDRTPESCTDAELEEVPPAELADIFWPGG